MNRAARSLPRRVFAVFLLTVCTLVALQAGADEPVDSLDKVRENLSAKKAVLFDVRQRDEWDRGHLRDAQLVPLADLKKADVDLAARQKLTKDWPAGAVIYCHCAKGVRAQSAGALLKKWGYDARPLAAGYDDLLSAGFPAAPKK